MSLAATATPDLATERWAAWDAFVAATPESGFMQSSWWADFRSYFGFDHFAVTFKHAGAIVGGSLVLRYSTTDDQCFYYMPDGPVLPQDPEGAGDIWQAILAEVNRRRIDDAATVSHLRIEPRWSALPPFATGLRPAAHDGYSEPRHTRCVDLRVSEAELLAQMKPKGRYNTRVAERHGVRVVEDASPTGLADFLRIYDDMVGRQGIEDKPAEYFEALLSLLQPGGRGSLFFAELSGVRLAAALVIWFGDRATYFFGASLDEHREVMAPYALHFALMQRARTMGLAWYDFWGVAPPNRPDHPWAAITTFKEKFGGVAVDLVPTLDLVYDEDAYRAHVAEDW